MSVLYDVRHVTRFTYSAPVALSHHRVHLTPRRTAWQTPVRTRLHTRPPGQLTQWSTDYFGNAVAYLVIETAHRELTVEAHSRVRIEPRDLPDPAATAPWDTVAGRLAGDEAGFEALEFCYDSPATRAETDLLPFIASSFPPGRPVLAGGIDLCVRLHREFAYDGSATDVTTTVDEAFAGRRGVCQDFAHVALACLRRLGLPARYVSGYLRTRRAEDTDGLRGADASHAWIALFCPGHGWIDLDPTNDLLPDLEHVTVAWGRDYTDVSPVRGVAVGGGEHRVDVAVAVEASGAETAVVE